MIDGEADVFMPGDVWADPQGQHWQVVEVRPMRWTAPMVAIRRDGRKLWRRFDAVDGWEKQR